MRRIDRGTTTVGHGAGGELRAPVRLVDPEVHRAGVRWRGARAGHTQTEILTGGCAEAETHRLPGARTRRRHRIAVDDQNPGERFQRDVRGHGAGILRIDVDRIGARRSQDGHVDESACADRRRGQNAIVGIVDRHDGTAAAGAIRREDQVVEIEVQYLPRRTLEAESRVLADVSDCERIDRAVRDDRQFYIAA